MQHEEALERIREVQRIAERTTLYTLLPGWQAIIGGVLALAGCAVSCLMLGSFDFRDLPFLPMKQQLVFCVMWTLIGIAAVAQDVFLTARAARQQGVEPAGRPGRFAALSLLPSVLVAMLLTVKFLDDLNIAYIAPVWMMCYGTGVYAAGLFSLRMVRTLGMAFLVCGALALNVPEYGVLFGAVSFGMLHLAFGIAVLIRKERGGQE
jgi:hypothetical protein